MASVLFLIRVVVLVLLWALVLAAIVAVRHDVFGTRPRPRPAGPATPAAPPAKAKRDDDRRQAKGETLVVIDGPLAGTTLALADEPITIGRADNSTLVLADDYVSTHHARLVKNGRHWLVEDLGSTNGTYLENERVERPSRVSPGRPIRVGKTVLEIRR